MQCKGLAAHAHRERAPHVQPTGAHTHTRPASGLQRASAHAHTHAVQPHAVQPHPMPRLKTARQRHNHSSTAQGVLLCSCSNNTTHAAMVCKQSHAKQSPVRLPHHSQRLPSTCPGAGRSVHTWVRLSQAHVGAPSHPTTHQPLLPPTQHVSLQCHARALALTREVSQQLLPSPGMRCGAGVCPLLRRAWRTVAVVSSSCKRQTQCLDALRCLWC